MRIIESEKEITPLVAVRRERVYLILVGFFLGAMTLLNVIGITKFIQLGPMTLAVGVLPYPLTFLCTDFISEFYGRRRANFVVWLGFVLNLFILFTLWLGDSIASVPVAMQPPWQELKLSHPVFLPNGASFSEHVELFRLIFSCSTGAVLASMIAYLAAQFCDVHLFHFWKNLTQGKHLWLRNNGSTLISQLVDSSAVIAITFGATYLRGEMSFEVIFGFFLSNYFFKFVAALLDTIPFYIGSHFLKGYLEIDPLKV